MRPASWRPGPASLSPSLRPPIRPPDSSPPSTKQPNRASPSALPTSPSRPEKPASPTDARASTPSPPLTCLRTTSPPSSSSSTPLRISSSPIPTPARAASLSIPPSSGQTTLRKLCVPRLAFQGVCCFAWSCLRTIRSHQQLFDRIASDFEPFVLPGLPHRIELTKAQLPTAFIHAPDGDKMLKMVKDAEQAADGMVFNSFEELEPEHYANYYEEATGKKAWLLGPVSLFNKNAADEAGRGYEAAITERQCLDWLDSRPPKSVVYVSFGSLCKFTAAQLMEIGLGLEASKKSFIWVVRKTEEMEEWLQGEDGFEERVKLRGLVIRGWAPQILILSHPATAGFVTHCGWNSTLEGISAGLPMISWPLSAEQFLNEKLLGPQFLGIAFGIGVKEGSRPWDEKRSGDGEEMVKREEVEKAIERLMDGGEQGEERRKRAEELGVKARKAMDVGGSSYTNMTNLIQHFMMSQAQELN